MLHIIFEVTLAGLPINRIDARPDDLDSDLVGRWMWKIDLTDRAGLTKGIVRKCPHFDRPLPNRLHLTLKQLPLPMRGQPSRMMSAPPGQLIACRWNYHITPAAGLTRDEFPEIVGAALRPSYRGGRWFESTAAHHVCLMMS